jgi:tRNA pseudouridine13 synthase
VEDGSKTAIGGMSAGRVDTGGLGGVLKTCPEDFVVEEIPVYEPIGEGPHLFLWVEKRNVAAHQLVRDIARHFDVRRGEVGMAGNKDKVALTRQWISVPIEGAGASRIERADGDINDRVRILRAVRHTNKLKTGHLRGNRFEVTLRGVTCSEAEAKVRIERTVAMLKRAGVANHFGSQRFGHDSQTLNLGLALLRGEIEVHKRLSKDRRLRRLALSAAQSAVFNEMLRRRTENETTTKVLLGDVLVARPNGKPFLVDGSVMDEQQCEVDTNRFAITGVLPGSRVLRGEHTAREAEDVALSSLKLDWELFAGFGRQARGARRPFTIPVDDLVVTLGKSDDELCARVCFSLPSGSFATIVLAEFSEPRPSVR